MTNQQTVLTALGCAGSLAAMLAISSPAVANMATTVTGADLHNGLPTLTQADPDPIAHALGCTCAICTMGSQRPVLF